MWLPLRPRHRLEKGASLPPPLQDGSRETCLDSSPTLTLAGDIRQPWVVQVCACRSHLTWQQLSLCFPN